MQASEREKRQALYEKAYQMRRMLETADRREFNAEENQMFSELQTEVRDLTKELGVGYESREGQEAQLSELKKLNTTLEQVVNPHKGSNINTSDAHHDGEVYRDREGHEFRVYRPDQKLSSGRSAEYDGLTLGGYMRSMILGPKNDTEARALSFGTDSAGGFTVPTALLPAWIDLMRAKSHVIRAGARTVDLGTGKTTTIARLASDVTVGWRAENAEITAADATFEGVTLAPKSLGALIRVSRELAEDSANLEEILQASFAGAFAGELDRVALIGTGTPPEPRGIKNTTNVNSYSMGTNGLALTTYEPFLQAINLIDLDNGPEPTAAIYAPRTDITVNLLKDTTNQPLQRPHRIANLPFYITSKIPINDAQGTANNASRIYLGDFSYLLVGVRQELRIEVLRERYAEFVQYGFVGTLRADIALVHPEAFAMVVGIIP